MGEHNKNQCDPDHSLKHTQVVKYGESGPLILTYDGCCLVLTEAPDPDAAHWPGHGAWSPGHRSQCWPLRSPRVSGPSVLRPLI